MCIQRLKYLFVLAWLFTHATALFAQRFDGGVIGISAFGIQSPTFQGRPCRRTLKILRQQSLPAISMLFETFGMEDQCLRRFWERTEADGKRHLTQIHFSNEVGRKNALMGDRGFYKEYNIDQYNELLEAMPRKAEIEIRERVRRIVSLIEGHATKGDFILGVGLEDNYTQKAFLNLHRVISEEWPYRISRNPARMTDAKEVLSPADVFLEWHSYYARGGKPGMCIYNGDGQDASFLEGSGLTLKKFYAADNRLVYNWALDGKENNCLMFLWFARWQGLHIEPPSHPSKREFLVRPNDVPETVSFIRKLYRNIRKKARSPHKKYEH